MRRRCRPGAAVAWALLLGGVVGGAAAFLQAVSTASDDAAALDAVALADADACLAKVQADPDWAATLSRRHLGAMVRDGRLGCAAALTSVVGAGERAVLVSEAEMALRGLDSKTKQILAAPTGTRPATADAAPADEDAAAQSNAAPSGAGLAAAPVSAGAAAPRSAFERSIAQAQGIAASLAPLEAIEALLYGLEDVFEGWLPSAWADSKTFVRRRRDRAIRRIAIRAQRQISALREDAARDALAADETAASTVDAIDAIILSPGHDL